MSVSVERPGSRRSLWIAATAILLTVAVLSILPAVMSIFLFDSPAPAPDLVRGGIGYAMMSMPLVCFFAAAAPWRFRTRPKAWWLFFLPSINGAVISLWLLPSVHMFYK